MYLQPDTLRKNGSGSPSRLGSASYPLTCQLKSQVILNMGGGDLLTVAVLGKKQMKRFNDSKPIFGVLM